MSSRFTESSRHNIAYGAHMRSRAASDARNATRDKIRAAKMTLVIIDHAYLTASLQCLPPLMEPSCALTFFSDIIPCRLSMEPLNLVRAHLLRVHLLRIPGTQALRQHRCTTEIHILRKCATPGEHLWVMQKHSLAHMPKLQGPGEMRRH